MKNQRYLLVLFLLLIIFPQSLSAQCGKWRRDIKILADQGAKDLVNLSPETMTIEQLNAETPPEKLTINMIYGTRPRYENEKKVVVVDAIIESYKTEDNDHDFHIVLRSPNSNSTIVTEIPDPECPDVAAIPELQKRYKILREWFLTNVANGKISSNMTNADPELQVKVVGIPFWDAIHPKQVAGAGITGREIHPIIDFITPEGSVYHKYKHAEGNITPKASLINASNNNLPQTNNTMETTTPLNMLIMILLGAILGAAGQGIRVIVGMKKVYDKAGAENKDPKELVEYKQMLFSLFIGFGVGAIAGVLAAVSMTDMQFSKSLIIAFLTAGYAGTDFIEGFMKKNPIK